MDDKEHMFDICVLPKLKQYLEETLNLRINSNNVKIHIY